MRTKSKIPNSTSLALFKIETDLFSELVLSFSTRLDYCTNAHFS